MSSEPLLSINRPGISAISLQDNEREYLLDDHVRSQLGKDEGHGGDDEHYSGKLATFINIVKGNIGSGVLSLPYAFAMSGYASGTILFFVVGIIAIDCMVLLLEAKREMVARHDHQKLSYGDVALLTMGKHGRTFINVFIVVTQFGFCCVYLVFISTHMNEFYGGISQKMYVLIIAPVFVVLVQIRSLKHLAPTSLFANCCILFAFIVLYAFFLKHMGTAFPYEGTCVDNTDNMTESFNFTCIDISKPVPFGQPIKLPIFFGNFIYAFEGIALVLPMENAISPESRGKYTTVLLSAMGLVAFVYGTFGMLGYLTFGSTAEGSITLNMPDKPLYTAVKISLCLALLFTYLVEFYPAVRILEGNYLHKLAAKHPKLSLNFASFLLRTFIVMITVALACAIPNLGLFISLIGSLGSGALALVFPPMIHLALYKKRSLFRYYLNIGYVIFGVIASGIGTYTAIDALVVSFGG